MNKIKPLKHQVIVRQMTEFQTSGGIILNANPEESKFKKGEVVAISDHLKERTGIVPGDHIIYSRMTDDFFDFEGEQLTVIRENDIGGTISGELDWA